MNTAKRRGRPPKIQPSATTEIVKDDEIEEGETEEDEPIEVRPRIDKEYGPPCPRCRRPTERTTRLFPQYETPVLRCPSCRQTKLENDGSIDVNWFDIDTACSGRPPILLSRAAALYNARRRVSAPPPDHYDPLYEAMKSDWDDVRWSNTTF